MARKPSYSELAEQVRLLSEQVKCLVERVADLERRNADLEQRNADLERRNAELEQRNAELEQQLQDASRQAARFRRRDELKKPEEDKKPPGRRKGHSGSHRPRPEQVDEVVEVPLDGCPHCHGELTGVQKREQFIEEIPVCRPICTKVVTWIGECVRCGEVQSVHPLQTSTATGAAGNHLGPRAQALALLLSHQSGLTMSRVCDALWHLCGLVLTPGGLAQLMQRAARRLQPLYDEIWQLVRDSEAVFVDETSWYVGNPKWWLWTFSTPNAALYRVEPGRGSDIVRDTLGPDFPGVLVSDCLSSYDPIDCRKHKCIAHHLRFLKEQQKVLQNRSIDSRYLWLWKTQLKDVIATWNQREELGPVAYARKVAQLQRGVKNLLGQSPAEPEEVAFRNRLQKQREHLLGCLSDPAAEPTNNRAERDLRPAVISRKVSCGNKTDAGKEAWEVLRSVIVTLRKQGRDVLETLAQYLRLPAEARVAG
jgi:hypothetical protein